MEKKPAIVAHRLTELREGIHVSQARLAAVFDLDQPAIFRYENAQSFPPYGVLMKYADFFNVSLDYIFGRCDEPHGQLYDAQPKPLEDTQLSSFLSMCFDPSSSANAKLKEAVRRILQEETANSEITNGETENEC